MVKKLKWNLIFMSLLYVGLGIFLVMKPGTALNIVCYALGGVVLACAAVQLIRYFVVERGVFQSQLTLISGLICLALGVFLLLRSDIVVLIIDVAPSQATPSCCLERVYSLLPPPVPRWRSRPHGPAPRQWLLQRCGHVRGDNAVAVVILTGNAFQHGPGFRRSLQRRTARMVYRR